MFSAFFISSFAFYIITYHFLHIQIPHTNNATNIKNTISKNILTYNSVCESKRTSLTIKLIKCVSWQTTKGSVSAFSQFVEFILTTYDYSNSFGEEHIISGTLSLIIKPYKKCGVKANE